MKTKVSTTSIEVYHKEVKGDKENSQNKLVILALQQSSKPMSAKMIQKFWKERGKDCEINVWSRAVNSCFNLEMIRMIYERECEVTGRTAKHYIPAIMPKVDKFKQVSLF